MKRTSLTLFILAILTSCIFAQQKEANVWMFGKYLGIDFNTTPPSAIITSAMLTFEGCATISDSDGNLLFYTDGTTVWNKDDEIMTNGTNLGGHMSSTQSAIIVPLPQHANIYYIFTVPYQGDAVGLQYSIVDMNESGGLGKVINKNIPLVSPVDEKVTAMKAINNEDIWVITHKWQWLEIIGPDTIPHPSNQFVAYKVTADGIDTVNKVVSTVGAFHGGNRYNTQGYMKGSPDGQKLALAVEFAGFYQLFNFDNETGIVSNPITLSDYTKAYGVEFSPNSRYLYVTEASLDTLTIMHIYQLNVYAGDSAAIINSKVSIGTATVAPTASDGRGALQVGPDQKIYVARYDFGKLGVINNPNIHGLECNFVNDGIILWNGTLHVCRMGLPTFIQSYFAPPSFIFSGICFSDTTQFTITSSLEAVVGVTWQFGDGDTSNLINPTHLFTSPAEYVVTLILHYETTNNTSEETIEILTAPKAKFSYDPYCFGSPTHFHDNSNPVAGDITDWYWDFGDGTATAQNPQHTFSSPGVHAVHLTVTTDNGCVGDTSQNVNQIQPPAVPATPTGLNELCENSANNQYQTTGATDAVSYQWEITPPSAGTISGSSKIGTVDWNNTFSGTASITVTSINTCGTLGNPSAPIQVTVHPLPEVNAGEDIDLLYNTSTTLSDATASGATPMQYQWEPADSLVNPTVLNPTTIALRASTIFGLTVTDDNACVDSDEMLVHVFGGPLSVAAYADPTAICYGDSSQLTCLPTGGSEDYSYFWTSNPPGLNTTTQNPKVWPSVTTTYFVTLDDGYNQATTSVTVTVKPLPDVDAGDDFSIPHGTSTTLHGSASGGTGPTYAYHWSPEYLLHNAYIQEPPTYNIYQSQVFGLKVTDSFGCINTDQVIVTITGDVLHTNPYSLDTAICYGYVTELFAVPGGGSGNYTIFNWDPDSCVQDPGADHTMTNPLLDTTTFYVHVYDGYNWAYDSVKVIMNPLPVIDLVPKNVQIINWDTVVACVYDTIILYAGNPGFDYVWSDLSSNDSMLVQTIGIGFDIQTRWVTVTNPQTSCYNSDTITIIFTFDACTGIDEHNGNISVVSYPNPTTSEFYLTINNVSGDFVISLFDLTGQPIMREEQVQSESKPFTKKIDLKSFAKGIYLLRITGNDFIYNSKIILQ